MKDALLLFYSKIVIIAAAALLLPNDGISARLLVCL